jgi:hypothetical protein
MLERKNWGEVGSDSVGPRPPKEEPEFNPASEIASQVMGALIVFTVLALAVIAGTLGLTWLIFGG